jgi:hypothetical protein
VIFEFSGPVFEWRGPAPYFYVALPADDADEIREIAAALTYGWGVIPVTVEIGYTEWTTSLFPKEGTYLVPLKDTVRKAEGIEPGATVEVRVSIGE